MNRLFVLFCFSPRLFPSHREAGLGPAAAVKKDVELLKRFCSGGKKRVLKSVQYTSGLSYLHILLSVARKRLLLGLMLGTPRI